MMSKPPSESTLTMGSATVGSLSIHSQYIGQADPWSALIDGVISPRYSPTRLHHGNWEPAHKIKYRVRGFILAHTHPMPLKPLMSRLYSHWIPYRVVLGWWGTGRIGNMWVRQARKARHSRQTMALLNTMGIVMHRVHIYIRFLRILTPAYKRVSERPFPFTFPSGEAAGGRERGWLRSRRL